LVTASVLVANSSKGQGRTIDPFGRPSQQARIQLRENPPDRKQLASSGYMHPELGLRQDQVGGYPLIPLLEQIFHYCNKEIPESLRKVLYLIHIKLAHFAAANGALLTYYIY
jgi:hypothetical protein